jgi:hypothetical protein
VDSWDLKKSFQIASPGREERGNLFVKSITVIVQSAVPSSVVFL